MSKKIFINKQIAGFTLIEIITTIVILSVIAILGFTYANNYKLTQFNVKRTADIETLEGASKSYFEVNKNYPQPAWNKKYYDNNWAYEHSDPNAYWVSWFATSEIFWKQFLATTPMDPQTKNFYSYAKTLSSEPAYQFATILDNKWVYYAYVKWNYPGEVLGWLIKEHNWPNFVLNWSSKYLPYNPSEVKLSWKITAYSWSVSVNWSESNVDKDLMESDTVKVLAWWEAEIHLSDWSDLKLWNPTEDSEIIMKNLSYKQDDNLLTKVTIKLSLWEIWVKAPQLENGSDMSVETDNAAASVRGTIFWVTNDWAGNGSIWVVEWKIQIQSIINNKLENTISGNWIFTSWSWELHKSWSWEFFIQVDAWDEPVILNYLDSWDSSPIEIPATNSTWTISTEKKNGIKTPEVKINNAHYPKLKKLSKSSTWTINLSLENRWGNWMEIYGNRIFSNQFISSGSGEISFNSQQYGNAKYIWIRFCSIPNDYCSVTPTSTDMSQIIEKSDWSLDSDLPPINYYAPANVHNCTKQVPICSIWKRIDLANWELSFVDNITSSGTVTDTWSTGIAWDCVSPKVMVWWVGVTCFSSWLIAYAPYNLSWDINFYTSSWMVINKTYWSTVVWMNCTGYTWWNCTESNYTYRWANSPSQTDKNNSFAAYADWTKWIYLNAPVWDDWIKYSVPSSVLNNNFWVEISVRWKSLKRTSTNYLWWFWDNRLVLSSWKLKLAYKTWSLVVSKEIPFNSSSLGDNEFYSIRADFTSWWIKVFLDWTLKYQNADILHSPYLTDIYVWTSNAASSSNAPWDDIIDYVKMYNLN
ncbi:MAG: hypothetical protein ACD_3C00164G0008 [uncultured bacterium (gcode 4)]|uniref:Prepilin-type N-terminal cleavage/methylation domain-containing protein n=1 Tax=uncultured bacterium (gcode 4) TaxID=1234023 RepID=K2F9F1_9BACT|nr:MAG: hypothetical protein ACD_3C00164G0008 [uncultured bacterium (gcode 4)]